MRKLFIISGCVVMVAGAIGCKGKNNTGSAYMPDMFYSRAYETYAGYDTSKFTTEKNAWGRNEKSKIYYSYQPVEGTVARGDMAAYPYKGDTTGYKLSPGVKNPLDTAAVDMTEAERLYLVNCAICHGAKLDGNGPLWNNGNGPYPAAPRNLKSPEMVALSDGTMFHSITFGRNLMGSYASQISSEQRWMIISFIRKQQGGGKPATDTTKAATIDTAAARKM